MYKRFYGLQANPFNLNPDPRFLYESRWVEEALACLKYGIESRKGFVMLTGEVGTGKTTLLNKLLRFLRAKGLSTAYVFNPRLKVMEFLQYMMADFGLPVDSNGKAAYLQRLNQFLLERYSAGKTAVLIVDEAQNLSTDVLEEIRMLTNLETSTEKLLQIILCGQPELENKMKDPSLRQLRQRIAIRARTHALNLEETGKYIQVRLTTAGASADPIFSQEAVETIFEFSRGIPRVINLMCEHALITGFADQLRPIPARVLRQVAKEFELDVVPPIKDAGENLSLVEALNFGVSRRDETDNDGVES
jgi:type II secretory pathway predicted ATPase ExeA